MSKDRRLGNSGHLGKVIAAVGRALFGRRIWEVNEMASQGIVCAGIRTLWCKVLV